MCHLYGIYIGIVCPFKKAAMLHHHVSTVDQNRCWHQRKNFMVKSQLKTCDVMDKKRRQTTRRILGKVTSTVTLENTTQFGNEMVAICNLMARCPKIYGIPCLLKLINRLIIKIRLIICLYDNKTVIIHIYIFKVFLENNVFPTQL